AEFLNAEVISVYDVEKSASRVGCNIHWKCELSVGAPGTSAHFNECSGVGKELHTTVSSVSHINCSGSVDRNALRSVELTVAGSGDSPLRNKRTGAIEFLNSIVAAVGDVEVVG